MTSRIGNLTPPQVHTTRDVTEPTSHLEVSADLNSEVTLDVDRFEHGTQHIHQPTLTPVGTNVEAPAPATVSSPLGLLMSSQTELMTQHNHLRQAIAEAVETFPDETRAGIQDALQTSAQRILTAHQEGRITSEEAAISMEMLREVVEGVTDLRTGEAQVITTEAHGDNVKVWNVRSPDGDELVVSTRLERDEQGEARFSIRHTVDDGVELKGRHRMAIRLDLERWGSPSFDVQFGESALDKRIHGLFKNPDGTVFETPTGKKLADHHFKDKMPSSLSDPNRFTEIVRAFANNTMEPLPVVP